MSNPYRTPEQQTPAGTPPSLSQSVRAVQIITFGMVMGVLVFLGISLVLNEGVLGQEPELLSWIAIGFAGLMFVNHLVIPNIVGSSVLSKVSAGELRNSDEAKKFELVFPAFQTRHIVACALLEGGAFFNLVTYLITEYAGNLVAASIQVAMIVLRFPTATRVQFWMQDRIREIELS